VRFRRKDPADTLGRTVERGESGERFTAADLAARHPGGVVRKDRPEANTSWVPPGRDAAGKLVSGAVVFGVEGMKALGAGDADIGFTHRDTVARFGVYW
jgi:hypothetical protein